MASNCDVKSAWSSDLELNQVVYLSSLDSEFLRARTVLLHVAYITKRLGLRFQGAIAFRYNEQQNLRGSPTKNLWVIY